MGKILIPGGGGGADLDVITATAVDVRKNKVIVDREGEPLAGTMKEMAGGTYTPGTADVVLVPANTFVTAPIIMKGDKNLAAGNIKKNVTIFNITGSFEGWVPTPQDLYYKGQNPAGFTLNTQYAKFENTRILITDFDDHGDFDAIQFTKNHNVQSYSRIIFEGHFEAVGTANVYYRTLVLRLAGSDARVEYSVLDGVTNTISLDITQLKSIPAGTHIYVRMKNGVSYFTRISFA